MLKTKYEIIMNTLKKEEKIIRQNVRKKERKTGKGRGGRGAEGEKRKKVS